MFVATFGLCYLPCESECLAEEVFQSSKFIGGSGVARLVKGVSIVAILGDCRGRLSVCRCSHG